MSIPSNLIPVTILGLPEDPSPSDTGWMMYVNNGNTYKVQVNAVLNVSGVPTSRVVAAGTGLTGGGALSSNITISVAPGGIGASQLDNTGVTPGVYGDAANYPVLTVDANGRVTAGTELPLPTTDGFVPTSRQVIAGDGLSGGGALTTNITLNANLSNANPEPVGIDSSGVSDDISRSDHVHPAIDLADTQQTVNELDITRGGTGTALASPANGGIVYSDGSALQVSTSGSAGQVLISNGPGAPGWGSALVISDQLANAVYAGPTFGASAAPTFRTLVNADLPNSGVTANTYGSASSVPVFTVNSKGVLSSVVNTAISIGNANLQFSSITINGTSVSLGGSITVAGTGTVTSVGMTVPTGLTVAGSPITTSGVFAITLSSGYVIPTTVSTGQWDEAYADRLKWDGGSTGLNVANAQTSLSLVVGTNVLAYDSNLQTFVNVFTLPTVDGTANQVLKTDGAGNLGFTTISGTGTVTSVDMTVPTGLAVSGNPITSSGTLAITYASGYAIPTTAKQTEWDSAYAERLQWDGGSTNLVVSTGRVSLLPSYTSNAGKVLAVNVGATDIEWISVGGSGTVTSVSGTGTVNGITLTGTITSAGSLTLGGTLSGIGNSQLTNSSVTFNGQSVALGASGTITANTTNALTIGTGLSGTSFNGSSATTIANTGVLGVTATSPVASSGGQNPEISMTQASGSVNGWLSSTDWTTFNNKTSNTGTVTSVGITPSTGVTVSNSPITTSGNITVGLSTKLTAIENLSGAGFITQNGSGTIAGRTIQAGTGISVANGNGSSQDPEISNTGVLGVTGTSPVASTGGQNPAISLTSGYGDTLNPYASKTANFVLAAPNGTAGVPTFRAVVAADIPTLNQNTTGTASNVTGTVAVANGGTGLTTLTANNVILGNGTSTPSFVAPGTSGNVLTSNGTTWTSAASGASLTGVTQSTTPFLTALGTSAGTSTTGVDNTFIGYESGLNNVTPTSITALGFHALRASNSGNNNTAIGANSQTLAIAGGNNTSIGSTSLYSRSNGNSNVAVGAGAGFSVTSGGSNTLLGTSAGYPNNDSFRLTTGDNNIIIGSQAQPTSPTVSNETTIGRSNVTSARIFGDLKFLNSYTELVFAVTGTTPALSPTNGTIQTWTLSGNSTPTAGTWANGQSLTLLIDDGTARTITWTSVAVTWVGGSPPTLNTTLQNVIELWRVGGVIYGASVGAA